MAASDEICVFSMTKLRLGKKTQIHPSRKTLNSRWCTYQSQTDCFRIHRQLMGQRQFLVWLLHRCCATRLVRLRSRHVLILSLLGARHWPQQAQQRHQVQNMSHKYPKMNSKIVSKIGTKLDPKLAPEGDQ